MNPPTNNWSQRRFMWNRRGHQNVKTHNRTAQKTKNIIFVALF